MANLKVKDAGAAEKYLKAVGAGTDLDPHVPEHLESNSAGILAAVQAALTNTQLRAAAVPVSDGNGSLTVDIAPAVWVDFMVEFLASDLTGNHTIIAAPGMGYKLQFQEVTTILGEDGENVLYIVRGATSVRKRPFKLQGEGAMRVWGYPDYWTLPENTALVVNSSAQKKWHVEGQYRIVAA